MATIGFVRLQIHSTIEDVVKALEPKYGGVFTRLYEHEGRIVLGVLLSQKVKWWRGSDEVAVVILLRYERHTTMAEVLGFAGGQGVGGMDTGKNKAVVRDVEKLLLDQGFKVHRIEFRELGTHSTHTQVIESIPGEDY
jgi:hypothetical protein